LLREEEPLAIPDAIDFNIFRLGMNLICLITPQISRARL
jgi:hypothetical protein